MKSILKVVHIIYRLDIGGLETVLVEFINRCPENAYRHVIISLTDITSFKDRIINNNVSLHALHKRPGKDFRIFLNIIQLLVKEKPNIVHTYNISTLEYQLAALFCRVPCRVHAEHGRDYADPYGTNIKYRLFRRAISPIIRAWVPVSHDLAYWLESVVKVNVLKIRPIHNGVDVERLSGALKQVVDGPLGFFSPDAFVIGTVGRLDPVKDHLTLLQAFAHLATLLPHLQNDLRLVIAGGGSLEASLRKEAEAFGIDHQVWFAGPRDDVSILLQHFDLFVLSSIAEGVPMTVLEAMAAGVPVVATDVGGVREVIRPYIDGLLVPPGAHESLANAIAMLVENTELGLAMARSARQRVANEFSLNAMTAAYSEMYTTLLAG